MGHNVRQAVCWQIFQLCVLFFYLINDWQHEIVERAHLQGIERDSMVHGVTNSATWFWPSIVSHAKWFTPHNWPIGRTQLRNGNWCEHNLLGTIFNLNWSIIDLLQLTRRIYQCLMLLIQFTSWIFETSAYKIVSTELLEVKKYVKL